MKKAVKYIISAAVAAAYIFIYGFAVGGETGFWFVFPLFTILFIIMSIFNYKDNPGMLKKTIRAILTPVIVVAVSMVMYSAINQTKADLAAEYDAVVTDRVKSTVYFYTPDGNEKQAALNTAIIVPEDEIIHIGDTIHIREYTGLFGVNFFATDTAFCKGLGKMRRMNKPSKTNKNCWFWLPDGVQRYAERRGLFIA